MGYIIDFFIKQLESKGWLHSINKSVKVDNDGYLEYYSGVDILTLYC